jgi:hypothetical protein
MASRDLASHGSGWIPFGLFRKKKLKIALLIVHTEARYFEILTVEMDAKKALVADILEEIARHAKRKEIRERLYMGLCNHQGEAWTKSQLLSTCTKGNEVLLAIPDGSSAQECIREATPVLRQAQIWRAISTYLHNAPTIWSANDSVGTAVSTDDTVETLSDDTSFHFQISRAFPLPPSSTIGARMGRVY